MRRRGRGRLELLLLDLGGGGRGAATGDQAARRHHRVRPEPDRTGDRVRLLLCSRRADVPRARLRGGDDQLQPGDRLDGLRHLRPPLLRAALARGGARRPRPRAAGGRGDPVRRPDSAPARPAHRGRRVRDHGHAARRDRSRRGQGALRSPGGRDRDPVPAVGDRRGGRPGARGRGRDRLSGARPALLRPRRACDACVLRRCAAARGDDCGVWLGAARQVRRECGRDRRRCAL